MRRISPILPFALHVAFVAAACSSGSSGFTGGDGGSDATTPSPEAGGDDSGGADGTVDTGPTPADASLDGAQDALGGSTQDGAADGPGGATQDATADASNDATNAATDASLDATNDAPSDAQGGSTQDTSGAMPEAGIVHPCNLPGSVQFTASGPVTVAGGSPAWPSPAFLTLPAGFCAHYFAIVPNARQLRFAPSGELFVASPTKGTTGGGPGGLAAVVLLADDNLDGVGDGVVTFLPNMATTQGLLFYAGHFYYQDGSNPQVIDRMPYQYGDRAPRTPVDQVADITVWTSNLHWPKTLDVADDGTIYVGNGSDQNQVCAPGNPFEGGILKIDPAPGGANPNGVQVAKGFRNPINVRCLKGHDTCFALELSKDYSAVEGGREKMVPIHGGDDWGFPCCATTNVPYSSSPAGTDCSGVTPDTDSFLIGDTPFGVDFEPGNWPSPWRGSAFVVTHGNASNWVGARMVAIPMNAATGLPLASNDIDGSDVGMSDFATGWDDGKQDHGRPAAVTFSADGRLFVANDNDGTIFWIASMSQ
jgi:glucose/arabinose dehydrogenase